MPSKRRGTIVERLEQEHGQSIEKIVRDAYNRYGTMYAAAEALGVRPQTFYGWMTRFRVEIQKRAVVA